MPTSWTTVAELFHGALLLEDGSSILLLEDGSSYLLLEGEATSWTDVATIS